MDSLVYSILQLLKLIQYQINQMVIKELTYELDWISGDFTKFMVRSDCNGIIICLFSDYHHQVLSPSWTNGATLFLLVFTIYQSVPSLLDLDTSVTRSFHVVVMSWHDWDVLSCRSIKNCSPPGSMAANMIVLVCVGFSQDGLLSMGYYIRLWFRYDCSASVVWIL